MAEELNEEGQLLKEAKIALLKQIIAQTPKTTGGVGVLNLAEAYTILDRGQLSGRVNAPQKS